MMEDLFVLGENDKFSLQEMIECDINSGYPDQSLTEDLMVHDPLEIANLSPNSISPHVSSELDIHDSNNVIDLKTLNNSVVWYANGVINISELQNGNINPNLLVNPQTGLPVTISEETPTDQPITISVSPVEITTDGLLQSPDSEMMSPGQSQYPHEVSSSIPVTQPNSVQYVTTQHQPTLCSIQNSNALFRHQTLTQHLLSNNNHHKLIHKDPNEKVFPKPVYSYSCLIAMALKNSETGALPVSEIYSFMTENFPYFKTAPDGWKNSVRHNLSLNKCFEKIENPRANGNTRKGCLWGLNPNKIEKMEEEIVKWRKKDPAAVKRSMSRPEKLEELERGNIGSHAPLPAGLKALRELQLMRLNNIHAAGGNAHNLGSLAASAAAAKLALSTVNSPTVTMVTPIYSDNQQTAVTQTVVARTLAQQLISTNVIASQAQQHQQAPYSMEGESKHGGVQVTMVEVVPQNKVQQIKTEPVFETTAERKPIVINLRNDLAVKREDIKKEEMEEFSLLDGSLNLDPSLSDFALQHLDELANEGINLDELPTSLNLSFSSPTNSSPSTVQGMLNSHRTSSPLVGFLQASNGGLSVTRTISALT